MLPHRENIRKNLMRNSNFTHHSIFNQFQKDGMSVSILELVPNADDAGKYLFCRAENRYLPEATIEDKWKLTVNCKYEHEIKKNNLMSQISLYRTSERK